MIIMTQNIMGILVPCLCLCIYITLTLAVIFWAQMMRKQLIWEVLLQKSVQKSVAGTADWGETDRENGYSTSFADESKSYVRTVLQAASIRFTVPNYHVWVGFPWARIILKMWQCCCSLMQQMCAWVALQPGQLSLNVYRRNTWLCKPHPSQ